MAEPDAGVKPGDTLLSCDGKDVDALLRERIDPYYWNAQVPHARALQAWRLFYQDRADDLARVASCTFSSGTIKLRWRNTSIDEIQPRLDEARGLGSGRLGIRQIGNVWLIRVPTFDFRTDAEVAQITDYIKTLQAMAPDLRKQRVVLDVRGNDGGNSAWGDEILAALWGRDWIDHIESQFDQTTDWRASKANIAAAERNVAYARANGQADDAAYYERGVAAMRAALARGQPYGRTAEPPAPKPRPSANPVTGHVFLFTDGACVSSCLMFADVIRRLPATTHIGFATFADTNYIDNTVHLLPSGLAYLSYAMKMYLHRVRQNNEWYEPQARWPGGPVTDASIASWVATLAM